MEKLRQQRAEDEGRRAREQAEQEEKERKAVETAGAWWIRLSQKQRDELFAAVAERAWREEQLRVEIPERPSMAAHFAYGVPVHSRDGYHSLYGIVRPCPEPVSLSPQLSSQRVHVRNAQEVREFDETLAGRISHYDLPEHEQLSTPSLNADDVRKTTTEHATFNGFVSSLIPASLLGSITGDAILAALMVSIVFGVALNVAGEEGAPQARGVKALSDVVFRIVGWVMRLAPLRTFGALATVAATYGAESLKQLGYLIILFTAICVIYVLVVLGRTTRRPQHLFQRGVLPHLVRKLEILGIGRPVVGIVIPSGFSFNWTAPRSTSRWPPSSWPRPWASTCPGSSS